MFGPTVLHGPRMVHVLEPVSGTTYTNSTIRSFYFCCWNQKRNQENSFIPPFCTSPCQLIVSLVSKKNCVMPRQEVVRSR